MGTKVVRVSKNCEKRLKEIQNNISRIFGINISDTKATEILVGNSNNIQITKDKLLKILGNKT